MENELKLKYKICKDIKFKTRDYCKVIPDELKPMIRRNRIVFSLSFFIFGLLILCFSYIISGQENRSIHIILGITWGGLSLVLGLLFINLILIYTKIIIRKRINKPFAGKIVEIIFCSNNIKVLYNNTSIEKAYKNAYETKEAFLMTGFIPIEKKLLSEEEIFQVREFLKKKATWVR